MGRLNWITTELEQHFQLALAPSEKNVEHSLLRSASLGVDLIIPKLQRARKTSCSVVYVQVSAKVVIRFDMKISVNLLLLVTVFVSANAFMGPAGYFSEWKKFESEAKDFSVSLPVGEDSPEFIALSLPSNESPNGHPGNRMHGQEEDVFYLFDYTEYAYPIGPALTTKLIKMYTESKQRTCKQISVKGLAGTECTWKTKEANSRLHLFTVKQKMYAQVVIRPQKSRAKDNSALFFDSLNIVVKE